MAGGLVQCNTPPRPVAMVWFSISRLSWSASLPPRFTSSTTLSDEASRPLRISVSVKEVILVAFWALFLMVLVCLP